MIDKFELNAILMMAQLTNLLSVFVERPWTWLAISTAIAATWAVPLVVKLSVLWRIPVAGEGDASAEERRKAYLSGARKLYTDGYRIVSCFFLTSVESS